MQIGKKEVKLSLCVDNVILSIENSKDAPRKLLELITECGQLAGYKSNILKSAALLYTNNELCQKEKLREQSHLPSYKKE